MRKIYLIGYVFVLYALTLTAVTEFTTPDSLKVGVAFPGGNKLVPTYAMGVALAKEEAFLQHSGQIGH